MIFRRWDAPRELRPERSPAGAPGTDSLSIRWIGTAGHALTVRGETLLLDPFVTRPRFRRLLRRLKTDEEAAKRWAPEARAIAVGHAHYDHLLDVPSIARRTGAVVIGNASAARVAIAQGVEEARVRAAPVTGLAVDEGPFHVRLIPSLHAKLVLGLTPPFPGEIESVSSKGMFVPSYRAGKPFGIVATVKTGDGDVSVYHNGSADLIDAELAGVTADVLLIGIAGWRVTRGYLERLVRLLKPKLIVPTHYDAFFAPLEEGVRLLPRLDLEAFLAEAKRLAPEATIVAPTPWEALRVDRGGARFEIVGA